MLTIGSPAKSFQHSAASMDTPTSTGARVFGIPELLENVLLCLPLKDLLFSQRVCKGWRATWTGSVSIQHALFLKPIRDLQVSDSDCAILKPGQRDGTIFWVTAAGVRLTRRPLLNPFLDPFVANPHREAWPRYVFHDGSSISIDDSRVGERTRDQMLITQPAARYPVLAIWGRAPNGICEHVAAGSGARPGVRVAEVKRLCAAHRTRCTVKWYKPWVCEYVEIEHVEMLRDGLLYTGHEMLAELERRCEVRGLEES